MATFANHCIVVATLWWRHHPSHSIPAIHLWLDHWKWITWPAIQLIKHWLWQQKLSFIAFSNNVINIIMRLHILSFIHPTYSYFLDFNGQNSLHNCCITAQKAMRNHLRNHPKVFSKSSQSHPKFIHKSSHGHTKVISCWLF